MGLASAIARSTLLAVVSAALTAPLVLLLGSIIFFVQVRLGKIAPDAGFEPNLFMRHVGLPASAVVLVVTFAVALWRLRTSRDREIRPAGR
jgi:hypothetical protein